MKKGTFALAVENVDTDEIVHYDAKVPDEIAWQHQLDWMKEYVLQERLNAKEGSILTFNLYYKIQIQETALPTPPPQGNQEPQKAAGREHNRESKSSTGWFFRLFQYAILLLIIYNLSIWQWNGHSLDSMGLEFNEAWETPLFILAIALAGLGTYLGAKGKTAVFTSKFDIFATGLAIIATIFCFLENEVPSVDEAFQILSIPPYALFVWLSFRSNNSLVKMIVVIPAKIACVAVTFLLGFFSIVAASATVDLVKEKKFGEAAAMAAGTATVGAGYLSMTEILESLIKKSKKTRRSIS